MARLRQVKPGHDEGSFFPGFGIKGPLREVINAPFGILGDDKTAVIEMAETSGLRYIEASNRAKDPMTATTYGVGQAILAALKQGKEIETVIIPHSPDEA
jgi:glycerate 2-kinase